MNRYSQMLSKGKDQKGITLIALIITIIVLLILSLVTINSLFSNDSAMEKARQARVNSEKGDISDMVALSLSNIKLKQAEDMYAHEKGYYYENKERFIESGGNVLSKNLYEILDTGNKAYNYNPETGRLSFTIKKKGGVVECSFVIDVNTGNIVNTNSTPTGNNGGSSSGNENNNNNNNGSGEASNVTPIQYVNPEFYVCDSNGNQLENQEAFSAYFDNDLETFVNRDKTDNLQIKWNGNIGGKLLYVKCTGRNSSQCWLSYKDSEGNTIQPYASDYTKRTSGKILDYQNDDVVTFIPENASYIELRDYETNGNIYEIGLFDAGYYANNYITNIKTEGNTPNKIGLEWTQTGDVLQVKVYNDGVYIGTSENGKYTIDSNLMGNATYNIFLEPITAQTTDYKKNQKTKFSVTTPADTAGFYVDGNEITKKYFTAYFDNDLETYVNRDSSDNLQIRWNGNIGGKLLYVKCTGRSNSQCWLSYKDSEGNTIQPYDSKYKKRTNGNILDYQNDDIITYIPENANYIEFRDYETNGNIYEIKLFDNGYDINDYISNVNFNDVGSNSLSLSWNKTSDVVKTKIYQDGTLLGETEGTTYTVSGGLLSNTEYEYYLEPVTANTTTGKRCKKVMKKVTTQSDGYDLYIDGTDNLTRKAYTAWFDKDDETFVNQYSNQVFQIKWNGNIAGKKLRIKTTGSKAGDYYLVYKDSAGNKLNAYLQDNTQVPNKVLNYQEGEVITIVPDDASYIEFEDWENGNVYSIEIVED